MKRPQTPEQREQLRQIFEAVGVKGQLAHTAARLLKQTPAYADARAKGRARAWLAEESNSFAETAYEVLLNRVDEAGGR